MQRKDVIVLNKVLSEIQVCFDMLSDATLEAFLEDEKLKRAVAMTVINIVLKIFLMIQELSILIYRGELLRA